MLSDVDVFEFYEIARRYSSDNFDDIEVNWQHAVNIDEVDESDFLREAAWVILNSGFREATVRRHFSHISLSFCDWESASEIAIKGEICVESAMRCFANRRKLDSILKIAEFLNDVKFDLFKEKLKINPIEELTKLPYIGKITCFHLAKNIGFDFSKPDRHLIRLSNTFGYANTAHMCGVLSKHFRESQKVIDLVLWRYLADHSKVLLAS